MLTKFASLFNLTINKSIKSAGTTQPNAPLRLWLLDFSKSWFKV